MPSETILQFLEKAQGRGSGARTEQGRSQSQAKAVEEVVTAPEEAEAAAEVEAQTVPLAAGQEATDVQAQAFHDAAPSTPEAQVEAPVTPAEVSSFERPLEPRVIHSVNRTRYGKVTDASLRGLCRISRSEYAALELSFPNKCRQVLCSSDGSSPDASEA